MFPMSSVFIPVPISERIPNLQRFWVNDDKLILLDEYQDILRTIKVGALTEWDVIKGSAVYWLEKQDTSEQVKILAIDLVTDPELGKFKNKQVMKEFTDNWVDQWYEKSGNRQWKTVPENNSY
jgi:hypothetical protein